jgi:hypothetical protein
VSTPSAKLAAPAWRQEWAPKAGRARTTLDHRIAKLVEQAAALTDEQVEALRRLLSDHEAA